MIALIPQLKENIAYGIERINHCQDDRFNRASGESVFEEMINALPLHLDMGGWYGLDLDGNIISTTWNLPYIFQIESDPRIRNMALNQGIQKFPFLAPLLPTRSTEDITCPHCEGSGKVDVPIDNIVCYCGGLGWIPKE